MNTSYHTKAPASSTLNTATPIISSNTLVMKARNTAVGKGSSTRFCIRAEWKEMSTWQDDGAPAAKIALDISSSKWLKLRHPSLCSSHKSRRDLISVTWRPVVSQVQDMPTWALLCNFSGVFSQTVAVSISAFCHAWSLQQPCLWTE